MRAHIHRHANRCTKKHNVGIGFNVVETLRLTFEDNKAEENGGIGFNVVDTRDSTFKGNKADDNGGFGFNDNSAPGGGNDFDTANFYDDNECDGNTLGDSDPLGLCV